jgi:peroxiredoxin
MAEISVRKSASFIACLLVMASACGWAWYFHAPLQKSPDIVLQIIDGRKIQLAELRGKPVLITFWATTCRTCIKKTPELKALYNKFRTQGVELIAVAMSYDPPDRILAFSRNNQIPYPIALDLDGSVAMAFDNVQLTPTTFLITAEGEIVFHRTGEFSFNNLENQISELLSGKTAATSRQAT